MIDEISPTAGCPHCKRKFRSERLSRQAKLTLDYMRREAPRRGGYMFENARTAFEAGKYHAADLSALLSAASIAPHADPGKGWVVKEKELDDAGGE